ncbi:hypothetical protein NQD34_012588 [Periophthalmus magnuspinnatus]|uniref:thrombopoietin n=1 Tax=Periophthalmus magnuspinnatus TaxID=409849 RepID=UPI00145A9BFE|nr:thrombopoietin [Periophthalmus magnuspinnatus]KAJ0011613.1 hypothetical protein NQD34_012588 [Periophthalmus magnuspinnatus]
MAVGSLLLLCVVISWPRDAQSLYIDFVCNKTVREALNIVSQMESDLLDCDDVATLPRAVQLPCTALHVASWGNKSLQEKRGDLVASLRLLIEGVKSASALNQTACATSVLRKLQHNVNNYLLILAHLDLSGAVESPVLSCVPRSTRSLGTVLLAYNRLLSGKLEHFMDNLSDSSDDAAAQERERQEQTIYTSTHDALDTSQYCKKYKEEKMEDV